MGVEDQGLEMRIGISCGGGIRLTIASRISSIPAPVLALARIASLLSSPMISSISRLTRSGSALGRSIC